MKAENKIKYLLQLADNALIIGHRLSEWCGHGPILEQDIALTNMSLDHLGQARSWYQYAAACFNELPHDIKLAFFTSPALQSKLNTDKVITEDDLAFLRDAWDFKNLLLTEQLNKDWAYTMARAFYYDAFNQLNYAALCNSKDATIAAIAQKSLKEVNYHLRWSSEWIIRLGDGTEESKQRIQQALDDLWPFTGELFTAVATDDTAAEEAYGTPILAQQDAWMAKVKEVLSRATLAMPSATWMQQGGKEGSHTEHLGYILAELQFMQRAYPGMEW